ncbi:hypothetical protein EDB89DRAFT_1911917 [Lactarius sanguifluus]|nr:hypothetical protein EDB89DRAFT_1911917 [Lactarius sanguifluus]
MHSHLLCSALLVVLPVLLQVLRLALSLSLAATPVIGSTAPCAGPFGMQGHHAVTLRQQDSTVALRRCHATWCWYATTPTPYSHAMTATRRHAVTPTPRHSSLALVHYNANTIWSRYDSDSAPRYDTNAAVQQLGAATWHWHANSDAAWSHCDSDTPLATSANDSNTMLQQYGTATEID